MKKIVLKPKKEVAVKRFHPWIFSGAISSKTDELEDGDRVEVLSSKNEFLGVGHFQRGSIMVRLFSFTQAPINEEFWLEKLAAAFRLRKAVGLTDNPHTNCYRLVHAEGDGLPGLIIDIYGDTAVMQCHSIGMYQEKLQIANALQTLYDQKITAIFNKSQSTLPANFAVDIEDHYLLGKSQSGTILENGHSFFVDWEIGQKTGFFLDQRVNRLLLANFCQNKTVLNAFCYSGGFSVYALKAGARLVHSVDISKPAVELTNKNVAFNQCEGTHEAYPVDVLTFLKETPQEYEVMVVDPPAFAKNLKKKHKAVQGYKRLNALALKKVKPQGIVFTFSCSQVIDELLFKNTIVAAALEAKRQVKILHRLSQPPDHPVHLFHPEGSYLKGLVLWIE